MRYLSLNKPSMLSTSRLRPCTIRRPRVAKTLQVKADHRIQRYGISIILGSRRERSAAVTLPGLIARPRLDCSAASSSKSRHSRFAAARAGYASR
jgi:hypothetical protein